MRNELYKQLYYDELARKNEENGKISTTILFISLFVTGIGVAIYEVSKLANKDFLWHISSILIIISLLIFAISLYFAYRTYFRYRYYLLTPQEIDERYKNLKEYYDSFYDIYYAESGDTKEALLENDFQEGLIMNYYEASKNNFENNNTKAKYQKLYSNTIIMALMILALNLLILYIMKLF